MMSDILARKNRLAAQFALVEQEQQKVELSLASVFANNLAIRCAGHVERSVQIILTEYARRRANTEISRYVLNRIQRENSINCEKIMKILDSFDKNWWKELESRTTEESRLAIDSLKTIRDQLAHGNDNGTGLVSIKNTLLHLVVFWTNLRNFC